VTEQCDNYYTCVAQAFLSLVIKYVIGGLLVAVFSICRCSNLSPPQFDAFLAVGGGSVIDTCKAANLFSSDPDAELLDYIAKPIGRGKVVTCDVKPLVAGEKLIFLSTKLPETCGSRRFDPLKVRFHHHIFATNLMTNLLAKLP
jgi:hypothetical protein